MKISIEVKPGTVKRLLIIVGGIALFAGAARLASAVPTTFADGNVLTAAQLNGNFADLEGRIAALETTRAVVKTGTHTGTFTDGVWDLHTGSGPRDAAYTITFATPFATAPNVTVGLNYVEATATDLRLGISVTNVTTTGFTVSYGTYSDTLVNAASVSWVATAP
jgi:hypothetical protein